MNQPLHSILFSLIPEEVKPYINDAHSQLQRVYNSETPNPLDLNFNDPTLKHAYFYRYFICISNAIRECWTMLTAQENVDFVDFFRANKKINVCCVGGGPGTDLVGFCQFLEKCDIQMKLNATILDRYDWSAESRNVISNIDSNDAYGIAGFQYVNYDLFEDPITPAVIAKIQTADLVTVVKFLSAVVSDYEGFQQFENLLSLMKPNARLFFMDNSGGGSNGRMRSAARNAGLKLVCEKIHQTIHVSALEKYLMASAHLETDPLMSTSVSASLWIKTD